MNDSDMTTKTEALVSRFPFVLFATVSVPLMFIMFAIRDLVDVGAACGCPP